MSPAPVLRGAPVARLVHVCLEPLPDGGSPVVGTRLTHQRRAGVILQAAGLLSLLDRAGWGLAGWDAARLGPDGRLSVSGRLGPARSPRPTQDLLRDLLTRLYGPGEATLRGPGTAKSALRSLAERWRQSLAPLAPDAAVTQILELAPFLWEPAFAEDRSALVGELHRFDGSEERVALWVAGPSPFRRKVLAAAPTCEEARALLAAADARRLWNREEQGDPRALAAAGRWRAALAAWERRPPNGEAERVERARTLAAVGRFEPALAALTGLDSPAALLARAECHLRLGQPGAALGALRGLQEARLSPDEAADLAEIAGRARANQGPAESALPWLRRALGAAGPPGSPAGLRTRIAAAAAAWDRRDLDAMERLLEESRSALEHPDLAWRWHQVRSLWELESPDGAFRAVEHAEEALRLARRSLPRRSFPRHLAADLWNEIGRARAAAGDLPGAERAFLHLVRLLEGCDGPRAEILALPNLAEIRLRRGRIAGVREILERATARNRRVGNVRGQAEDAGLWARFELVLGRPEAALTLCRQALADLERQGVSWHRAELLLLSARALGWLGRPAEAADALREVPPETDRELEPEERPALHALAGDLEAARREVAALDDPDLRALWETLLGGLPDGEIPPAPVWGSLAALEPYRAARLVHDAERLLPGSAPADVRRRASEMLREVGAASLAEFLETRDHGSWGSWQALVLYLLAFLSKERDTTIEPAAAPDSAPVVSRNQSRSGGEMVGESPAFRNAIERLDRLATGDFPLLILGESGTGKELAARRVHRASRRAAGPFVAVNCAALSETLLLSELFGHVRGAFTGADKDRAGVFQTAHGGTVFLDEIGDLPLNAQSTLLRTLQEGEVRRLGDNVTRKIDVRVVAATHRNLAAMVEEKTFRLDLYHRLKVGQVELPALRDRGDDVLLLIERFLDRTGARLSRPARDLLTGHAWPGNVRELQNVLSAAAALAGGGVIEPEHLDLPVAGPPPGLSYHEQIAAERRRIIVKNLNECGWRLPAAARRLGLSRQGLHHLIQELGLARELGLADRSRAARGD